MAANTNPIFGRTLDVQVGGAVLGPTAVTLQDGTGATPIIFMADATEGGFVDEIRLKPVGSPAATVCRIFFCTSTVAAGIVHAGHHEHRSEYINDRGAVAGLGHDLEHGSSERPRHSDPQGTASRNQAADRVRHVNGLGRHGLRGDDLRV
jgi:hypothetical protein